MPKMFISYRRDDNAYAAQAIYHKLAEHYGAESVMFDVEAIPYGVDFVEYLNQQVSECDVLLAVIGGQLVAALVSFVFSQEPVALLDTFWGVVNSIPAALGWLLIVFVVLQWLQVRPEHEEKEFDPRMLPPLRDFEPVNRIEQLVDIIFGVIFLFFFSLFAENLFQAGIIRQGFLANPVIVQYLPWISLSILLGLIVDILLLWRGHWQPSLRLAKIAANLFSLGLLFLMIQGHTRWLQDAGVSGFIRSLVQMPQSFMQGTQVAGMVVFRMALSVAFVIIAIETLVQLYRLVRGLLRSNRSQPASLVGAK